MEAGADRQGRSQELELEGKTPPASRRVTYSKKGQRAGTTQELGLEPAGGPGGQRKRGQRGALQPPLRGTVRSLRTYRESLDHGPRRSEHSAKGSSLSIAYMFWPQEKPISLKSMTAFLKSHVCDSLRHPGMIKKKETSRH